MSDSQPSNVKGELTIKVLEASGRNKEKQPVWESNFATGFVKVEIRGESRTIKAQSTQKRVLDSSLRWDESLKLNVLEDAKELRLMLCRERRSANGKVGASVTAACGIYVREILEAVPVDKYFELFKPGAGGEGGTIHIQVDYRDDSADSTATENGNGALGGQHSIHSLQTRPSGYMSDDGNETPQDTPTKAGGVRFADTEESAASNAPTDLPTVEEAEEPQPKGKGGFPLKRLVLLAAAVAAGAIAVNKQRQ